MNAQAQIDACTNLDALLAVIKTIEDETVDFTSLPTFGGDEPRDTMGVWSWDATRLIVGACRSDFEIVDRADHE